jgi:hypothetical protein
VKSAPQPSPQEIGPVNCGRKRRFFASRTVTFLDNGSWGPDVDVEDEKTYVESRADPYSGSLSALAYEWFQLQFALRLLLRSREYEGFAVGRYGLWVPILNRWLRLGKRVVMMDTEWRETSSGRMNRRAALASDAVCCFTRAEIERYSRHFEVPLEKFRLVLLAFQSQDVFEPGDEGYVFTGGKQGRDWNTFFRAVEGLPYPVKLYATKKPSGAPPNVTVASVSREEFYRRMAAASCVVVPLIEEPLRIPGDTTWTNAMGSGKVVIATDPVGAPDYMEHGVSGYYVRHGDADALRQCIVRVMEDPELRRRVGAAARERAQREFSPDVFRRQVLALLRGDSDVESIATPQPKIRLESGLRRA